MQEDKLFNMRHSAAHVMAAAVLELYPGTKLGIGPVIENGFYYDFQFAEPISEDDLKKIEKKMREILKRGDDFVRQEMSMDDAIAFFKKQDQDFKVDLLNDLKTKGTTKVSEEEAQDIDPDRPDGASIYKTGNFVDLCRGPHVENSKQISGWFKLQKLAGAYWRGNENNAMLTRIYGVLFEQKDHLKDYLKMLEEAAKRDHRKLGQELDLFTFSDLVGPGLPLFTPRGTLMREVLTDFVWQLMKPYGYQRVRIPHMAKSDLYKTSGHWDKFADDIFHVSSQKTDTEFVLKPMNCPHHAQIFASRLRSYRDLPIRYSEVTAVYRDENTGQLQGLSRVRSITQDDAHVFCTLDQVKDEVQTIHHIFKKFYKAFGMGLKARLSIHDPKKPEKYLGDPKIWQKAVGMLKEHLDGCQEKYEVAEGEAAFYGPKIDFIAQDAIGRDWQLATVQLDFNQPERFKLEYVDENNERVQPVMIHRAILGSVERFMGLMIEHYAGAFPMWLAPEQIRVVTVSDDYVKAAKDLHARLSVAGMRVTVDISAETVGKKIRSAAKMKVPWTVVVGEKEAGGGDITVNVFGQEEDLTIPQKEFIEKALAESKMPV